MHTPRGESTEQEFLALFEDNHERLLRFVCLKVGDRHQALDILQDVFLRTWQYVSKGAPVRHPEAFLYRVARNAVIDFYKRRKTFSLELLMDRGAGEPAHNELGDHLKKNECDIIAELVRDLSPKESQIIFMRYVEELPIETIANHFNKSTNAMTVHIHRIVKKLKSAFDTKTNGTRI